MRNDLKRLAVATCIGMFLVVIMGALVTKTESGLGCGNEWPLCNGRFVPSYSIPSIIEYSHRFVSGIVGLLVLATLIAVWRKVKRRDARLYAASTFFFTMLQAALGALAVKWPQSPPVLALHFGFSLLAFAGTLLLVLALRQYDPGRSPQAELERFRLAVRDLASRSRPGAVFRNAVWGITLYSYAVIYLGAYIRHTESSGGCAGWPLCNGQLVPELSGATGIVFLHRIGAVLLLVLSAWLAYAAKRSEQPKEIRAASAWALYFVLLQILSGAFVTWTLGYDWFLMASLIHAVIIAGLFGTLCYLSVLMLHVKRGQLQV